MAVFDLLPAERLIACGDPCLQYTGRMDDTSPDHPVMQFVGASVRLRLRARTLRLFVENATNYGESYLGVIANGTQYSVPLPPQGERALDLSIYLQPGENDVLLFKRQDACHMLTLHGFAVPRDAQLLPPPPRPARRMEFFGDSITAGEGTEAIAYCAHSDPPQQSAYSNCWWGYAWQTARALGAQIHHTAQGGIALLDKTGWFNAPDFVGMLSCWDKTLYNPFFGLRRDWDFSRYQPHVAVVALGQNDANPVNVMAENPSGKAADHWRRCYRAWLEALRGVYPRAEIILTTTNLMHDPAWDEAIETVWRELREKDAHIHHFLYTRNGAATPGHIRKPEAEEMARELTAFIEGLGEDIWR